MKLSGKEFEYVSWKEGYKIFEEHLYDNYLLTQATQDSLSLMNLLEIDAKLQERYAKFPEVFIYESNKTEGSRIPFEQLQLIAQNKNYSYKVKNEIQEVENSFLAWNFLLENFLFNEGNIKKLYHILTKDLLQENWNKYPRWFKKIEIVVNNNITSKPEDVSKDICLLLNSYRSNKKEVFPLQLAFDFHLKYEQIHPFENGNGRTGRLLLNKILISRWYLPMIIFESNRKAYFNAIDSANGWNKKKYYTFMLEQYSKTLDQYWKA